MVAAPLVESKIDAGRRLVEFLDQSEFSVEAAMWLFRQEAVNWRLILASRLVDIHGPRETYRRLQQLLSRLYSVPEAEAIRLHEIQVLSPKDELIRLLRHALENGPSLTGLRFTGSTIDGVYIDDAYIYRLK